MFGRSHLSLISPRLHRLNLNTQISDLSLKLPILLPLPRKESHRNCSLFSQPHGGQKVGVAPLVVRPLKVIQLDPAHINQCLDHIVSLAQADAQLRREFTLSQLGVFLKQL